MARGGRFARGFGGVRRAGARAGKSTGALVRRVPWRKIGGHIHTAATWHLTLPIVVGVLGLALIVGLFLWTGRTAEDEAGPKPPPPEVEVPVFDPDHSMPQPPKLVGGLAVTDLIIYSPEPLSDDLVKQINRLKGVARTDQFSMGSVSIQNTYLNIAAVDPATFRRFAKSGLQAEIWSRVAAGEMAIRPNVAERVQDSEQYVAMGSSEDAAKIHIGAYTPLPPTISMAVNKKWGEELLEVQDNAMLVWTAGSSPQVVRESLEKIVDKRASIQEHDAVARTGLDPDTVLVAVPTSGSVGAAIGVYNYTVAGNRVIPSASWTAANLRTETMPLIGRVTCHKDMLPQLRAALDTVIARGLGKYVYQTAGCFNARFIANTTSLSNHSFGMAIDINSLENGRGTVGQMHPDVVEIFRQWGFAWGGDWAWTDPMHFELVRIVKAG